MSTDTPITDDVLTHNVGYANYQLDMLVNESRKLERENARLREDEKGLLQDIQRLTEEAFKRDEKLAIQSNANVGLMEELAEAKRDTGLAKLVIQQKQDQIASAEAALEQSEARALEYKTEHAALLGTSQWQETEIADLRDDVKRHMQIASECEERALANEKDAGRLRWLLEDHDQPETRERRNSLLNRMQVMSYSAACTDIDSAIGAKHDNHNS